MPRSSKIRKVYAKVNLREQSSDFSYWQTRPYEERLAALEDIRRDYHRWKYGAEPRLQKVYRIVKQQPPPENQPQNCVSHHEPE